MSVPIRSLQKVMLDLEREGFSCGWREHGMWITEPCRIIHFKDRNIYVIYAAKYEDIEKTGMMNIQNGWAVSYVLGGPPFWTTANENLALLTAISLNIPIIDTQGEGK